MELERKRTTRRGQVVCIMHYVIIAIYIYLLSLEVLCLRSCCCVFISYALISRWLVNLSSKETRLEKRKRIYYRYCLWKSNAGYPTLIGTQNVERIQNARSTIFYSIWLVHFQHCGDLIFQFSHILNPDNENFRQFPPFFFFLSFPPKMVNKSDYRRDSLRV